MGLSTAPARFQSDRAMCLTLWLMAMFVWDSWAVHVAFVAPPASHYAPMLPIAHGLLDDGHQVSFVGFNETVQKIKKLVPKAGLVGIGPIPFDREKMAPMQEVIQSIEYRKAQVLTTMVFPMLNNMMGGPMATAMKQQLMDLKPDVLCVSHIYPILYALGEVLQIPVVGIGWATPSFLTMQIDLPWATEPNVGSIHSRQEIYQNPMLLVENTLVRIFGFFMLRIGSVVNMWYRFKLGHPRPLEVWEFDAVLQHPLVVTSLPELSAGMPSLLSPYTFPVGVLDHVALEGSGMMKSDDQEKIIAWLDAQLAEKKKVLYVAFGSEVRVGKAHATLLVEAFKLGAFTVLWATKVAPPVPVPEHVLVTKFAPQRAVLNHPAVFGFVSHGGMNSVNEALAFGKPMAIMPFMADQMMVAVVHRDLGVAVLVNKNEATPQSLTESIRQIASEAYQRRSAQIRKLNEERKDMSRAVEVIVNQATGAFRLHVPPCPHILIRCIPLFLTLLIWGACCNCCGCLHVRPQIPCACCRSGKSSAKANGRTKQD